MNTISFMAWPGCRAVGSSHERGNITGIGVTTLHVITYKRPVQPLAYS